MDANPMTTTEHLRLGMRVLKRFFDIFVAWPATLVACCIFLLGLSGEHVARNVLEYAYQWGDQTFRNVPIGMALVEKSGRNAHNKVLDREDRLLLPPPILVELSPVPTQEAIDHDVAALATYYWICVFVSSGAALSILGPRRFIGLSIRHDDAKHLTQG